MNLSNEPILTATSVAALVSAVMGVLVVFGVPLTQEQRERVLDLVLVAFPIIAFLVAAIIARSKVVPQTKIDQVPLAKRALEQERIAHS